MTFSIAILVVVIAIAYFHYTQGLFSATISAICACLAAVLAFSYHEPVIFALLKGRVANYAHAMILVAMFAGGYLLLRVIFDSLVPGNVRFPLYVERVGGAVMGLFAGIFAAGILAVAAQALPFGAGGPYARYELAEPRDVTVPTGGRDEDARVVEALAHAEPGRFTSEEEENGEGGMILPVDDMLINLVDRLSTGALAGTQPLSGAHPDYLQQLFAQRVGIQVGASRVAINIPGGQQQVSVQGVYTIDEIAQADAEIPQIRGRAIKGLEVPIRKPAPTDMLLVLRAQFGRGADDKDHNVRFSPASMRLVAGGKNHFPIGTIDEEGVLRVNLPDDFLVVPGESAVDLVYSVPREDLAIPPAPTRARTAKDDPESAPKLPGGVFFEAKRMGVVELAGQAIVSYPGPLEKTVLRKRNIPKPKAPGLASAAGEEKSDAPDDAAPAAEAPIVFKSVEVSANLFTQINVAGEGDGEKSFPSGSANVREGKIAKLDVNMTQTIELLSRGDYTIGEFYVPAGMKMVQVVGTAPPKAPPDPWDWADKLGQFELVDSNGTKYKPNGGWARVRGAQGSNRMVARYEAESQVSDIPHEEGRPTEVRIAFLVPEGTQLTELQFDGNRIAAVDQTVE